MENLQRVFYTFFGTLPLAIVLVLFALPLLLLLGLVNQALSTQLELADSMPD